MGKQSKMTSCKDEDYDPKSRNQPGSKNYRRKQRSAFIGNSNKWTFEQNSKFLNFLIREKSIIDCQKSRKQTKVFVRLSTYITTRSPDQCRSHHQKMIKHHRDIDGIIQYLQLKERVEHILKDSSELNPTNQQKIQQSIIENVQSPKLKQPVMREILEQEVIVQEDDLWALIDKQVWIEPEQDQNLFCFSP